MINKILIEQLNWGGYILKESYFHVISRLILKGKNSWMSTIFIYFFTFPLTISTRFSLTLSVSRLLGQVAAPTYVHMQIYLHQGFYAVFWS